MRPPFHAGGGAAAPSDAAAFEYQPSPGTPYAASAPGQPRVHARYIVYGIGFDDAATAALATRIMLVAVAMSALALASAVLQLITGSYWSVGIFSAVVLPLCGYYGVRNRSRATLACFSGFSGCLALLYLAGFITATTVYDGDFVACACNAGCAADAGISPSEAARVCASQGAYRLTYWLGTGFGLAMMVLQFMGCYYGRQLLHHKRFFAVRTGVPVAAAAVDHVPVGVQPVDGYDHRHYQAHYPYATPAQPPMQQYRGVDAYGRPAVALYPAAAPAPPPPSAPYGVG